MRAGRARLWWNFENNGRNEVSMKDDKEISREQRALIRLADKRSEEYFAEESAERAQRRKELT